MVHTRAFSAERDSLADLALVGTAAMSSERHFLYFRRHHAKHPETGATMTQTRLLKRYYAADYVTRVAVSDDSDAFVDMSLGDEARRMRGTWAAGVWMGDDARLAPERRLVAEGRLMGYSTWSRTWPLDRDKERLLRMGAGRCWPEDSIYKKLNRALLAIQNKYASVMHPDPAQDTERNRQFVNHGQPEFDKHMKPLTDTLQQSRGYIFCWTMAVDPSFQRRGIGAALLRWGLEQAARERVPVLLFGSAKGAPLYQKLGFEDIGLVSFHGLAGDRIMVYWPPGVLRVELA